MKADAPSRTALVVAGGVVFAAGEPGLRAIIPPESVELTRVLLGATSQGRRLLRWIDARVGRSVLRLLERATIPGIVAHWVCRKRWIEEAWVAARAEGFDTLVVLGSGLDTLSLRVARETDNTARIIDVDHPATLAARRTGIASAGGASPRLVAHDLGGPGLQRAIGGALTPDSSTFVILEGVLMYLEPGRVDQLFSEIAGLPGRRLRVAFTFMETRGAAPPAFRPRSGFIDFWLARRGEPFRSGLDPDSLPGWLGQRGFALRALSPTPGHSRAPGTLPRGECAAVANAAQ